MNHTASAQKKKRRQVRGSAESDSVKPVFFNSLKGLSIGIAAALPLLLLVCAVAMNTNDPASLSGPLSYVALLLSALIAGIASAKINRDNGMLCGIICGALYLAFIFTVSLFIHSTPNGHASFIISLGLRSVVPLSAIIGGCLGEKKEKAPKRRKRH